MAHIVAAKFQIVSAAQEGGKEIQLWPVIQIKFGEPVQIPSRLTVRYKAGTFFVDDFLSGKAFAKFSQPYSTEQEAADFTRLISFWGHWYLVVYMPGEVDPRTYFVTIKEGWEGVALRLPLTPGAMTDGLFKANSREFQRAMGQSIALGWQDYLRGINVEMSDPQHTVVRSRIEAQDIRDKLEKLGGPLPWKRAVATATEDDPHELVVRVYNALLSIMAKRAKDGSRPNTRLGRAGREEDLQAQRRIWAWLRNARLFECSAASYVQMYNAADKFTTERIGGVEWASPDSTTDMERVDEEMPAFLERVMAAIEQVGFPERLPFDSCYFAWARGVPLPEYHNGLYGAQPGSRLRLMATLVVATGQAFDIVAEGQADDTGIVAMGGGNMNFLVAPSCLDGKWEGKRFQMHPWIIHSLVGYINSHHTSTEGRLHQPQLSARPKLPLPTLPAPAGKLPLPYYKVVMQADHVKDSIARTLRRLYRPEWGHRWDVRGHEVLRILRGTLPILPEVSTKLVKRGYTIFTHGQVSPDVQDALQSRRIAPRGEGEWLAIHVTWRGDYIKGPEDKPYIPSMHVPSMKAAKS